MWLLSYHTVHAGAMSLCLWTAATNLPIFIPPGCIWVCRAMMEGQGETEDLGEKPVPVSLGHFLPSLITGR
jgi:hypothetical protein